MSEQPTPKPNDSQPTWELVVTDMLARDHLGRQRYGTPLQAGNGRDMLRDAYEEALDLAVYLRGAIAERDMTVYTVPSAERMLQEASELLDARSRGSLLPYKVLLSDYMRAYPHFTGQQIIDMFLDLGRRGSRVMLINDLMEKGT